MSWDNVPQEKKNEWQSTYTKLPKQDDSWDNIALFYYLIRTKDEDVSTVFTEKANQGLIRALVCWIVDYKNQAAQQQQASQQQQDPRVHQQQQSLQERLMGVGGTEDGVYLNALTTDFREKLVQSILDDLTINQTILIKSMPGSGKTTLLQLVIWKLSQKSNAVYLYDFKLPQQVEKFQAHYQSLPTAGINSPHIYFVIDDVQEQYGIKNLFREITVGSNNNNNNNNNNNENNNIERMEIDQGAGAYLKSASTKNAHFLLASTYSLKDLPTTPFIPSIIYTFNQIKIQPYEEKEFIEKQFQGFYLNKLRIIDPDNEIINDILQQCGGHPFFIKTLSNIVINLLKHATTESETTKADIMRQLTNINYSAGTFTRVWTERNVLDMTNENQDKECFKRIITRRTADFRDENEMKIYLKLVKAFYIEEPENLKSSIQQRQQIVPVQFNFKMIIPVLYSYLYPETVYSPLEIKTIVDLVIDLVKLFKVSDLRNGLDNTQFPREYYFQHLFFHYLTTRLPKTYGVRVSKSIGKDKSGYIDFYLNSLLCWGIEFLVGGSDINKHLERFTNGQYDVSQLQSWIVVDFWNGDISGSGPGGETLNSERVNALIKNKNYLSVKFKKDFTTVVISQMDEVERVFNLQP